MILSETDGTSWFFGVLDSCIHLSCGGFETAAARVLRQLGQIAEGPCPHLVAIMEANSVIVLVLEEGAIDRVDAVSTVASERLFVLSGPETDA